MPVESHRPRKRFGQHFLCDQGIIGRILLAVRPDREQPLVEIGPGLGALTLPLLEMVGRLDTVELDQDIIPVLQRRCQGIGDLSIHNADALGFDFGLLRRDERRLRIVGNLPYNISTPLLFHLISQLPHICDMHFMLQREVADRLVALPRQAAYGRLSVMLQYRCRIERLFTVDSAAFSPPPKVVSAFVRLVPYEQAPVQVSDHLRFGSLVRQAFSQRRKTLRNALRGVVSVAAIREVGIDPNARPETLSLAEFALLSNQISMGNAPDRPNNG